MTELEIIKAYQDIQKRKAEEARLKNISEYKKQLARRGELFLTNYPEGVVTVTGNVTQYDLEGYSRYFYDVIGPHREPDLSDILEYLEDLEVEVTVRLVQK